MKVYNFNMCFFGKFNFFIQSLHILLLEIKSIDLLQKGVVKCWNISSLVYFFHFKYPQQKITSLLNIVI